MNLQRPSTLSTLLAVLISAALPVSADAYDVPLFHEAPFDRDGIFLEDGDRQSLLEALASIACNFRGTSSVDEDLIEKSLAIALTIDPFHGNSRKAHEKLSAGEIPEATQYFNSRSATAEALWGVAIELVSPPIEPEAKRLAPLLMELSLLIHPAPTTERILQFDQLSGGKGNSWKNFVSLQEDVFISNERLQSLMREAKAAREENTPAPLTAETTKAPKPAKEPTSASSSAMIPEPTSIQEEQRSISGVFAAKGSYYTGTFSIEVRAPAGSKERELFPFLYERPAEQYPYLPIFAAEGLEDRTIGLTLVTKTAQEYDITWQQGAIAEAGFKLVAPPEQGSRPGGFHASLPLILSLKSISESRQLNPSVGIIGAYELDSPSFLPTGNPVALITASKALESPYVLIHADTLPDLLTSLAESEDLEILFYSDLLSFETLDEVYEWVTLSGVPASMIEASGIFAEIKTVSTRMPLPELARNVKVQERLEAILELVPNHFSARAMLEFGRSPVSDTALMNSTIAAIDTVIDPYFALRREFRADTNTLRNQVEAADQELARLRTEVPDVARNYHTHAEDMIDAAAIYLEFSNKTTSIAEQRLRELKELFDLLDSEREVLGLPSRRADD